MKTSNGKRAWLFAGVLSIISPSMVQARPLGAAWPMWGQNARHTFRSPFLGDDSPGRYRWRHHLLGTAYKAAAVTGAYGEMIFTSDTGTIYATRHDGVFLWTHELGSSTMATPAITEDGLVIVPVVDGTVHAVDEVLGGLQWVYVAPGEAFESDAVISDDGRVYVLSSSGILHCLDESGVKYWSADIGAPTPRTTPSLEIDGSILVATLDPARALVRVGRNGAVLETLAMSDGSGVSASPAVEEDGTIYVATQGGSVEAIDPRQGTLWWTPLGGEFVRGLAVGQDVIAVGSTDFNLYVLDKATGTLLWSEDMNGPIEAPPTIDDNDIIYAGALTATISSYYPDGNLKYVIAQGIFHGPITIGADGSIYSTIDWSSWVKDDGGGGIVVAPDTTYYSRGDTLTVSSRIFNNSYLDYSVDLRVWVEGPDRVVVDGVREYGRFLPGASDENEESLTIVFGRENPLGAYSIHGVMTDPDSGEPLYSDSETFTLGYRLDP